ncbi:MAG: serine/threonine protein kinase [Candidatus Krumholzibacteria bacterium]|nr:serine/threonine protein kinase [Candidatus Krumholzibacteria bacterium]
MIELEKYEIVGEIGHGGMATVYKARHKLLHNHVAIKVLFSQFTHDGEFLKRFINGARSAASLKHENIIPVYDVGDEKGNYYIVMEYLEGETLEDRVRNGGAIPEPEIEAIMKPLAGALEYAHSRGVIHRDIKSANIFLAKGGRVVLMDFDIAKASDATLNLTQDGTLLGTPAYMSPEQARGEKTNHLSDIYSFGVVLYEMATGRLPFQGENTFSILNQIATTDPPPPREFNPKLGGELGDRILWCMQKTPGDRPAKASEIFGGNVPGRKARKDKKKGTGFGFGKGKGKKDDGTGKKDAPAQHEAAQSPPAAPAGQPPAQAPAPGYVGAPVQAPAPMPGYSQPPAAPMPDYSRPPTPQPPAYPTPRPEQPPAPAYKPKKRQGNFRRKTARAMKRLFWLVLIVVAAMIVREKFFPNLGRGDFEALFATGGRFGRVPPPRAAAKELSEIDRETAAALYAAALEAIAKNEPDRAREKLAAIRKIDPGSLLAHEGTQKLYDWHIARAQGKIRAGDYKGFEEQMERAVRCCPSMRIDNLRQRAASYRTARRYISLDTRNAAVVYIKLAAAQVGKLAGKLTGSAEKKLKSMG